MCQSAVVPFKIIDVMKPLPEENLQKCRTMSKYSTTETSGAYDLVTKEA
jgi:hypothetical protein